MHFVSYSASLSVLLAVSTVFGAPAQLDKTTLAQNGRDAHVLNLEFTALKASDDCTTGQIACISDAVAQCVNSKWKLTDCLKGQSCFALPSIKDDGVNIQCTSEATAKSIIQASGVDGDIVSNDKDAKPVAFPSSNIQSSKGDSDEEKDDNKNPGQKVTVTVTSTITASPSISSISSTQTLSPQDAARLLSSLSASAPKTISAPEAPGATPTSASSSSASEPPVIQLTPAAESASTTSSASSSTATATPSAGALAVAPAAEPSPADGSSSPY
jgi:hypothetical protein